HRAVERRVDVDPLAAARGGNRIEPLVAQGAADPERDLRAVAQAHVVARVEIEYEPVGIQLRAVLAEAPLRHVELERGDLPEPYERRLLVHEWVGVDVV